MENYSFMDAVQREKDYYPALDSLRFYACLLIIINHTNLNKSVEAHPFFFVLSGFVISLSSYQMVFANRGRLNLKKYLFNRIIRTFPVYYLVVLICGIGWLVLRHTALQYSLGVYPAYFLFLHNLIGNGKELFALINLWAMGVTEQLYLIWGILVYAFPAAMLKYLHWITAFALVYFLVVKPSIPPVLVYANTLSYLFMFLFGAFAGTVKFSQPAIYKRIAGLSKSSTLGLTVLLLLLMAAAYAMPGYLIRQNALAVLSGGLLSLLSYRRIQSVLLNHPLPRYLGKITYGIYVYHGLVLTALQKIILLNKVSLPPVIFFGATLTGSVLVAWASYELMEKKLLRLKKIYFK